MRSMAVVPPSKVFKVIMAVGKLIDHGILQSAHLANSRWLVNSRTNMRDALLIAPCIKIILAFAIATKLRTIVC